MPIWDIINDYRLKKDIKNMYKDAYSANFERRKVSVANNLNKQQLLLIGNNDNDVYDVKLEKDVNALDFIWSSQDKLENIVISSGKGEQRSRALMPFIRKAQNDGLPIIALHSRNKDLEKVLIDECVACEIVSRGSFYYDAFRSLPQEDITHLLYESLSEVDGDTNSKAEVLISVIVEVLLCTESKVNFLNLSQFPIDKLMDRLNELLHRGAITHDEYVDISHNYMMGSSEISLLRSFFVKLQRQVEIALGKATNNGCNIKKMLNLKGISSIDIGIGNNDLFLCFIITHIKYLQGAGWDFAIIIDGIDMSNCNVLTDILRRRTHAITHNDLISSLYGGSVKGDELFTRVMGEISKIVLFRHTSSASSRKWSEYLGNYRKIIVNRSVAMSSNSLGDGNRNTQAHEEDEPRVRPETLSILPDDVVCIYDNSDIFFVEL